MPIYLKFDAIFSAMFTRPKIQYGLENSSYLVISPKAVLYGITY